MTYRHCSRCQGRYPVIDLIAPVGPMGRAGYLYCKTCFLEILRIPVEAGR